jgi:uncharacterized protein
MPPLSVLFKTVSTDCNLDCSYCYYRQSLEGTRVSRRIDRGMLEVLLPQYMEYVADVGQAGFAWQGGEPTLAGLDFFRWVVGLQESHARRGTAISNALQTNGVLLDDAWGSFLRQHNFLVGISLDGPAEVHDIARKDRGGHGSFRRVMAGVDVLRRHGVDFNCLCVIGPHNVHRTRELMRFFRNEGFSHIQFIPAMDFQSTEPEKPAAYSISPEEYGEFLVQLFDEWYQDGKPRISIRTFDSFLQSYLGAPNELCVHGDSCTAALVVEYNGDVYPCDFFVHPSWKLGNILSHSLRSMAESDERARFVGQKQPLPAECQPCEWKAVCRGGCPRNRLTLEDGRQTPEYFCRSYKRFFSYADGRLRSLCERVISRLRYLRQSQLIEVKNRPRLGRNDPCPCGSGRKHKVCCGDPVLSQSYVFRQVG